MVFSSSPRMVLFAELMARLRNSWRWFLGVAVAAALASHGALAMELTEPPEGGATMMPHPHFAWKPVPGAGRYAVQIGRDASFQKMVDEDWVQSVVQWYVTAKELAPGTYFWRVRPERDDGKVLEDWSAPRGFRVETPRDTFVIQPDTPLSKIREIGEKAGKSGSALIRFEKGDYHFELGFEEKLFEWANVQNIIVDGGGSRFYMDCSAQLVDLFRCRCITVENLTFNHEPEPVTSARLISVDAKAGTADVEILAGFSGVKYPRKVNQFFMYAVDPEHPLRKHPDRPGHTYLDPGKTEDLGGKLRRYHVKTEKEKASLSQLKPGDHLIVPYRRWPQNYVRQCEDITFTHYTGGASEGALFMGGGNEDMKFLGNTGKSRNGVFPSAPGWVTGNDRRGPWVEGCLWEGMSDDGPNITGNVHLIREVQDKNRFKVQIVVPWQDAEWRSGDELVFWNPLTGLPIRETSVVSCEQPKAGGEKTVVTRDPVERLVPGPSMKTNTHVYNLSVQNRQLVLRYNTLIGGRRFGFNIKTTAALVEGNYFKGQGSCALYFENEPSGCEGLVNRNIVVQDNTIVECGRDRYSVNQHRANIHFNLWCNPPITATSWIGDRNILIRRNTILDRDGIGIGVNNSEDVVIEHNWIGNRGKKPFLDSKPADNAAIRVFPSTRNITVRDNWITDSRPGYIPELLATPSK